MKNNIKSNENDMLRLKCSSIGCSEPACTYAAFGIVRGKAKNAYTDKGKRLFKIEMKGDVAVPVCAEHKAVLEGYFHRLNRTE